MKWALLAVIGSCLIAGCGSARSGYATGPKARQAYIDNADAVYHQQVEPVLSGIAAISQDISYHDVASTQDDVSKAERNVDEAIRGLDKVRPTRRMSGLDQALRKGLLAIGDALSKINNDAKNGHLDSAVSDATTSLESATGDFHRAARLLQGS